MRIGYNEATNSFYYRSTNQFTVQLPQIIWHVTDRCYLSCPYCFATKTGKETNLESLEEYILMFKKLGVQKIDIAGGDPATFSNLHIICERLREAGIAQTITTSGTGKSTVLSWIAKHADYFSRIILSIDGSTAEDHDKLRGLGAYERLVGFFEMLENKTDKLRVNTVITQHLKNRRECKQIVNLVKQFNPIEWCLIQPHPANKKELFDLHSVSDMEFFNTVNAIKFYADSTLLDTRITVREVSNYAKYWILSAEGVLSQHTEGPDDQHIYQFNTSNLSKILNAVTEAGVWVPMKKKGMKINEYEDLNRK